jgi:hypothetical protein
MKMKFIAVLFAALTITSSAMAEDRVSVALEYSDGGKYFIAMYSNISSCRSVISQMNYKNVRCESHLNGDVTYGGKKVLDKTFPAILVIDSGDQSRQNVAKYADAKSCAVDAKRFNDHNKNGHFAWCNEIKTDPAEAWNRHYNQ